MKRILLVLISLILIACSKDDVSNNSSNLDEFIEINGDVRNLENLSAEIVERHEGELLASQLQISLEMNDPTRKTIGDIGGFHNEKIRLWVTILTEDNLNNNPTSFSTVHDDNLIGTSNSSNKINVFINLLTDEEDEKIYGSTENGQQATAYIKDGFLIAEWDKLKFVKDHDYSDLEFTSSGRIKGKITRNDR